MSVSSEFQDGISKAIDESALTPAIERTRDWLLGQQAADGHWCAELEGDTILESEYILLLAFLGRHQTDRARKAAQYILDQQLPGGGWAIYPGGPVEISASVKSYWALKLTGHDPNSPELTKAREVIRAHGGADAVNSFTRFYFALLGQIDYRYCANVPPEMVLLPKWAPIHLYMLSAWSRTILVPLSIMSALQPVVRLDESLGIQELFLRQPSEWPPMRAPGRPESPGIVSWDWFFQRLNSLLGLAQRWKLMPCRQRAIRAAEKWTVERFTNSEGLGAIFPPMIFSVIALRALGYADDSQELRYCYEHLDGLIIEDESTIRLQPCKSPVWDTAITLRALAAAGVQPHERAMQHAVEWLLAREVRRRGDWAETVHSEPGGWCFEYANDFYPDIDDSIMVLMALGCQFDLPITTGTDANRQTWVDKRTMADRNLALERIKLLDAVAAANQRATHWVLAMQNRDGGWGAFDRDNDREFLCRVPFADHNAMIDPSTPDLTGRVLEMLGLAGGKLGESIIDTAVSYLRRTQEPDGAWLGRWGVNYVYGTWQVLVGLAAVGMAASDSMVEAGAEWLLLHQQSSGAWGESPATYDDDRLRGQGPATPSQTAWALLGLMAAGHGQHPAVARGVQYLLDTQQPDGDWEETEYTGTGFPRVFYLRYHYYRIYFPLLALATYRRLCG